MLGCSNKCSSGHVFRGLDKEFCKDESCRYIVIGSGGICRNQNVCEWM